ncbi:MAG: GIY-YIG nuclease family protein [Ignavibacteriales bacterium]|nr:GIY-YIG nuclease family protein [Ignavibacteriales bacterium]
MIYVGKAKNLRNRVRSYFHRKIPTQQKLLHWLVRLMICNLVVTDSELEALILENNLIKAIKTKIQC